MNPNPLLLLLLAPLIPGVAEGGKTLTLSDFEDSASLRLWGKPDHAQLVEKHATSGKQALKVTLSKSLASGAWSRLPGDWSRFDHLRIDFFNPGKLMKLALRFKDGSGKGYDLWNYEIPNGPHRAAFELKKIGAKMNLSDVRQFWFHESGKSSPPVQKEAILAEDILAMVATLPYDLRGLRDRAILLLGYAGGVRRSEIGTLDVHKDDTPDSGGWIEIFEKGALLTLNAKTGWREVEIGRGSKDQTCPVHALEQWLHFAKIDFGPVFVGTSRDGKRALDTRLNDKHVARLVKRTVLDAGIRSELPEKERLALFSGHSLRAGLASSAEVDERYVQKQLGHASAEMTRRYQRRRDRFRVNLTKAAGL